MFEDRLGWPRCPVAFDTERKGKPMNIRAILCAASLAVLITNAQTSNAQQGVKIGALRCDVAAGLGLIVTSSKDMNCLFTSASGQSEPYYGTIRKFGLDIGATDRGVLAWDVFAPSEGPERGALAGDYAGVDASATIGAGGWRERAHRRLWPLVHVAAFVNSSTDRPSTRRRRRVDDASPRALNTLGRREALLPVAGRPDGPNSG
jgi:hypothetical protein